MQEEFKRDVAPYLDPTKVGVMRGDAAYNARGFRIAAHSLGYVPNTHHVSHAERETSKQRAANTNAAYYRINGKPNWKLNGHNELSAAAARAGPRSRPPSRRREREREHRGLVHQLPRRHPRSPGSGARPRRPTWSSRSCPERSIAPTGRSATPSPSTTA